MYRAIGFDLGETLIHYEGVPLNWQSLYQEALAQVAKICLYQGGKEALDQAGSILAKYNTRLYPRTSEVSADTIFGEVLMAWGIADHLLLNVAKRAFFSFFQRTMLTYVDTLPTLQTLKAKGIKIGILTDVPYGMEREYVEHDLQSIAEYIDVFITSVEAGYRKPDAHGYLELARRLDVQPDMMIFVGNEEKDIVGANNAGMLSVLLDREGKNISYGETWKISSLAELSTLLFKAEMPG